MHKFFNGTIQRERNCEILNCDFSIFDVTFQQHLQTKFLDCSSSLSYSPRWHSQHPTGWRPTPGSTAQRWKELASGFTAFDPCPITTISSIKGSLPDADGSSTHSRKDMWKSGTFSRHVSHGFISVKDRT
jgi:hypothetical protein